ncbi:MAG: HopJ type III effector protein [Gammaproteobacteria bacterium]|nr:HopJ type III effector protein [Gammaproteobacteria bacterium]
MTEKEFLNKISNAPEALSFKEVMVFIAENYQYHPVSFTNGKGDEQVLNAAGTNEGSCKIFAFAQLNKLNESQTLHCFGDYYRQDVMQHPEGSDHANIRAFMAHGWAGIDFDGSALVAR